MGDRLKYERFIWFHGRVKSGKHPNARDLCEKFELSIRTAQRDIEFMRERLDAPLTYSAGRKGYYYTEQSFELPGLWYTEESIIALTLAVRLASSIPDDQIKNSLCSFFDKLLARKSARGLCLDDIPEKISVKNIEYSKTAGPHFHLITDALLKDAPLTIEYFSPHTRETTKRRIQPLHLLLYMGSWHIIAYCDSRKELRDFVISRIRSAVPYDRDLSPPISFPSVKKYIRKNFGIMQGDKKCSVKIKFSPALSDWIGEQVWHPEQKITHGKDGSLTLRFPVADFREIKRRILSYGADIQVLSPKSLASDLKSEIEKMGRLY